VHLNHAFLRCERLSRLWNNWGKRSWRAAAMDQSAVNDA